MSEIELEVVEEGILVNGYIFSKKNLKRIKTRIIRNKFNGDYSLLKGMSGTTIIRENNKLILGKPKLTPKQSWSYKQWVRESDYEWTEYAKGTSEEWEKAFSDINI